MTWSWECGYRLIHTHSFSDCEEPLTLLLAARIQYQYHVAKVHQRWAWRPRLRLSSVAKARLPFTAKHHSWTQSLLLSQASHSTRHGQKTEKLATASPGTRASFFISLSNSTVFHFSKMADVMVSYESQCLPSSLTALLLGGCSCCCGRIFNMVCFQASLTHSLIPKHSASVHTPHFRVFKRWRFPVGVSRLSSQW